MVTSEAVERLVQTGNGVDQVTYLDPHDFNQGTRRSSSTPARISPGSGAPTATGRPSGKSSTTPAGRVHRRLLSDPSADAYVNGSVVNFVPAGRPIPGAYNVWLNDGSKQDGQVTPQGLPALTAAGLYDPAKVAYQFGGDDTFVWLGFYLATVTGKLDANAPQVDPSFLFTDKGFALSRLAQLRASHKVDATPISSPRSSTRARTARRTRTTPTARRRSSTGSPASRPRASRRSRSTP